MKRSNLLIYVCFALIIAGCFGKLKFSKEYLKDKQHYEIHERTNGLYLKLWTPDSYNWILSDPLALDEEVYVSVACGSWGSVPEFGPVPSTANINYPDDFYDPFGFTQPEILPLVGNNFPKFTTDIDFFYYTITPAIGKSQVKKVTAGSLEPQMWKETIRFKYSSTAGTIQYNSNFFPERKYLKDFF